MGARLQVLGRDTGANARHGLDGNHPGQHRAKHGQQRFGAAHDPHRIALQHQIAHDPAAGTAARTSAPNKVYWPPYASTTPERANATVPMKARTRNHWLSSVWLVSTGNA